MSSASDSLADACIRVLEAHQNGDSPPDHIHDCFAARWLRRSTDSAFDRFGRGFDDRNFTS